MRQRIQQRMILVIAVTLIISYAIMTYVVYRQNILLLEEEIRQEAEYICAAVRISGTDYLEEMDAVRENTRITLIDQNGEVLYDSRQDEVTLYNHKDRPEVAAALKSGEGQDIRRSDTLDKEMFYYALRLSDKTILRVSKTIDTAFRMAVRILPTMAVIAGLMLAFAWLLSRQQVARLIRPVNELDLNHPLDNEIYEELTPLLERIDRQNRDKDEAVNIRKEFSANVSHELKTPLTSISGYAEIMKDGLVKPEDMETFSRRIYEEASRLIVLVEDIMKLSRLDEGKAEIDREDVELFELARRVADRLSQQAASRNIHIEVTGEPVHYLGIRQILDEIVYNICDNAIKYNRDNGFVSVWVGNTLSGRKIIVTDTGIGIPKDQKERVFERFYRVDKSHSKASGGTGLGLSIVKHGAMIHDIDIRMESEPGKGTKIELIIDREMNR